MGPKMCELAGAEYDGAFFNWMTPGFAADARRVLEKNEPGHPFLSGDWPDYPTIFRKLNPFAGDKSALDNDE